MKKSRRWVVVPVVGLLAYAGLRAIGGGSDELREEPPETLFNRIWMEKIPDKPVDYVQGMFVLDQQPFGAFQRASAYDFHVELFEYDRSKSKLDVKFPQSNKKASFSFTVKGCDVPPFDLCLTLTDNPWGGPKAYYGFRDAESEAKALPGARERAKHSVIDGARAAKQ